MFFYGYEACSNPNDCRNEQRFSIFSTYEAYSVHNVIKMAVEQLRDFDSKHHSKHIFSGFNFINRLK